jgi:hypothetical protein
MRNLVVGAWLAGAIAAVDLTAARAQDTTAIVDGPRAERLRQLIEDRFAERLTVELGLSNDQLARVRGVLTTWATRRRQLEREDRSLRQELAGAMRPGVAADERAVSRLTDQLLNARVQYVQTFKDEQADLAPILSPIQRAQYVLLRDRLIQRVQDIREQRATARPLGRLNRLRP